jgi:hypothetical protein
MQANCQYSSANGVPNTKVKKDMSDCTAKEGHCSYQVKYKSVEATI